MFGLDAPAAASSEPEADDRAAAALDRLDRVASDPAAMQALADRKVRVELSAAGGQRTVVLDPRTADPAAGPLESGRVFTVTIDPDLIDPFLRGTLREVAVLTAGRFRVRGDLDPVVTTFDIWRELSLAYLTLDGAPPPEGPTRFDVLGYAVHGAAKRPDLLAVRGPLDGTPASQAVLATLIFVNLPPICRGIEVVGAFEDAGTAGVTTLLATMTAFLQGVGELPAAAGPEVPPTSDSDDAAGRQRLLELLAASELPGPVELQIVAGKGARYLLLDPVAHSVEPMRPTRSPTARIRLRAAATAPTFARGAAGLPLALLRGDLQVMGGVEFAWAALAALDRAASAWRDDGAPPSLPAEAPATLTSPGRGLPPELTDAAVDQMLLAAAVAAALPVAEAAALTAALEREYADGHIARRRLVRYMVSLADLVAGNSDHMNDRADLQLNAWLGAERDAELTEAYVARGPGYHARR